MKKLVCKTSAFALLLALAMVFFAACSNNDDSGDTTVQDQPPVTDTGAADTGTQDDTVAPPADVTPEEPQISGLHAPRDLGGNTINLLSWWPGSHQFFGLVDEPDPGTANNYFIERLMWDNARRVEREFNVNFYELLLEYGYVLSTLSTSVLAGSPIADIAFISGGMTLTASINDVIQPLDEAAFPGSDLFGAGIYSRIRTTAFGHDWIMGPNEPNPGGMSMGVNLDIINAIGVQNPVDLYLAGQWNWENALNIMRTATRDTTGDGTIDQWGIAGQPGDFVAYLIGGNDGMLVTEDLNVGFDQPNAVEALEFAQTIFSEGLWQGDPLEPGDWGTNFWAHHEGNAALFTTSYWTTNYGDLPFEFAVVPWPIGPSNTSGNTFNGGWQQGFSFPTASDWSNIDLLTVFEELTYWPGDDPGLMAEGVMNMLRGRFLTEEDAQRQMRMMETMASDLGFVVPEYHWFLGGVVGYFLRGEQTVSQAVEIHRPVRQEMLDNFFR